MKKWMSLILVGLAVITPTHRVVLGQGDEPTLIPFTDETFSIQGLVPEGWNEIAPGVYARALTMTDVALVAEQSTPGTIETTLNALLPQLGLTEAPQSVGTVESDALTWTLYQVDVVTVQVDLALAEADGQTYIVVLQASADEYPALHESVFLPVIDALLPYSPPIEEVPYVVEEVTFANEDIIADFG